MFKFKLKYIIFAITLFLIEVFIALYINDNFIRPNFGDFLIVILLYYLIMGIFDVKALKTAIIILLFAYIVEFSQYLHIVQILGLEKIRAAVIIIGNSFSWNDIICYTLGILFVLILERKLIFNLKGLTILNNK